MEKLFQGLNKHRIWGYEIFSVPLYLFLFLAIMVFAANQMDVIPGSMVGSIGAMFVIGIITKSRIRITTPRVTAIR